MATLLPLLLLSSTRTEEEGQVLLTLDVWMPSAGTAEEQGRGQRLCNTCQNLIFPSINYFHPLHVLRSTSTTMCLLWLRRSRSRNTREGKNSPITYSTGTPFTPIDRIMSLTALHTHVTFPLCLANNHNPLMAVAAAPHRSWSIRGS